MPTPPPGDGWQLDPKWFVQPTVLPPLVVAAGQCLFFLPPSPGFKDVVESIRHLSLCPAGGKNFVFFFFFSTTQLGELGGSQGKDHYCRFHQPVKIFGRQKCILSAKKSGFWLSSPFVRVLRLHHKEGSGCFFFGLKHHFMCFISNPELPGSSSPVQRY